MYDSQTGIVFDIQKFSLHNGPGIRTSVFFKGCPLRCRWCHNPESQALGPEMIFQARRCIRCGACRAVCGQDAIPLNGNSAATDPDKCTLCGDCVEACYAEARQIVGREMSVAQVMADIERDVTFFDESGGGVTFSGGEPLFQPKFLRALLRACREQEIHTALDTCGFASWRTLESIRPYVDLFLYDLKLMDDKKHREFTGVSNELILDNLRMLAGRGHNIVVRVPLIPGVNDDEENLRQIGVLVSQTPGLKRVDILAYHHTAADKYSRLNMVYELPGLRPPSDARMNQIAHILQGYGLQVNPGG